MRILLYIYSRVYVFIDPEAALKFPGVVMDS